MDRRNFLKKSLFGSILACSSLSIKADEKKNVYKFEDIFFFPYDGNKNLVYVRDNSFLAQKIYKTGKVKHDDREYHSGIYFPKRDILLQVKDEYFEYDFDSILYYLENDTHYDFISFEGQNETTKWNSPMRFIINNKKFMSTEFLVKHM